MGPTFQIAAEPIGPRASLGDVRTPRPAVGSHSGRLARAVIKISHDGLSHDSSAGLVTAYKRVAPVRPGRNQNSV
jgi:hypothetical protein